MKRVTKIFPIFLIFFFGCSNTGVEEDFEHIDWWYGNWQNTENPKLFFSIGKKYLGIVNRSTYTPQYFISTRDSVISHFYLESLEDFSYKKKWKIIYTSNGLYIRFRDEDFSDSLIEIKGPSNSLQEMLLSKPVNYKIFRDTLPLIPDSVLFEERKY